MSRQYTEHDTAAVQIDNERLFIEADSGTLITKVVYSCVDRISEQAQCGSVVKREKCHFLYILRKLNESWGTIFIRISKGTNGKQL
jgi:hypothetical protein